MSGINQRGTLRWKEWVPLISQQQRLRNLIQVIAYNIRVDSSIKMGKGIKLSYYYTLHLTTMSSPLYTSERLESENPKWSEIEVNQEIGSSNGVVIRLWCHSSEGDDKILTVWGVYFSGLVYLGPRLLSADPSVLDANTIVFHMQGGYFTAPHCFLQPHPAIHREFNIQMNSIHVRPSYSVNLLLRLQTMQHAIKKQASAAVALRERISAGNNTHERNESGRESKTLRRLLGGNKSKPSPRELLAVKREIEMVRFKVQLLAQEKDRGQGGLRKLSSIKDALIERNQEKSSELMEKYCGLNKDIQLRKAEQELLMDVRSRLSHTSTLLDNRRKELMAELSFIYPITQLDDGKYTIRAVHLPNSEDFEGKDEMMISVALGFVAHLVQMMAYFLNIPTRYPIRHFGSRSKVVDHITDKIPDKEREFPLYSRGKEKLPFDYAVYLLNKNIAQLRWCCGITTTDLRATLPNLSALMTLNKKTNSELSVRECGRRTKCVSCSLDGGGGGGLVKGVEGPCSDPQPYTHRSPLRTPVTDLASLMSLDYPALNGDSSTKQSS